jgi:hypothetical protein
MPATTSSPATMITADNNRERANLRSMFFTWVGLWPGQAQSLQIEVAFQWWWHPFMHTGCPHPTLLIRP